MSRKHKDTTETTDMRTAQATRNVCEPAKLYNRISYQGYSDLQEGDAVEYTLMTNSIGKPMVTKIRFLRDDEL